MKITKQTQRRFVLGRQGLWPGRRWAGWSGTAHALRAVEAVQVDPLQVVARSHDIVLWGRVLDYSPAFLEDLLYQERQFFEYGGGLFIYPIDELPYWRHHMKYAIQASRWATFAAEHPDTLDLVRAALEENGPLGTRDFSGNHRIEKNYRGRKDTSLALYYLWLSGELLIHHRERFEKVYGFRREILPEEHDWISSEEDAAAYFSRKAVAFLGLSRESNFKNELMGYLRRQVSAEEAAQRLESLLHEGIFVRVDVEGEKKGYLALQDDLSLLEVLESGGIPAEWAPLDTTTEEEVTFLAPLEIASARGRASGLFDFDYIWEVYKPAEARRWGYYTLPILYGDRLVGRLDPRLERDSGSLRILGFWLEPGISAEDPAFRQALARGLRRFQGFLDASRLDLSGIPFEGLRDWLEKAL